MPQTAEAFLDQQAPDAEAFLDDAPSAEKFIESSVSRMADATRATVGVVGRAVAAFDMAQAGASGETQPSAPEAVSTDEFGRPLDPRGLNPSGPNPAAPTRLIGSEGLAPLLAPLIPLRKAFSQGEQLSYLASQQPEGAARQTLAVAGGVVSGVEDVVGGAMEFMTSPVGIATMGLGAAPGALRAVASGTFAADMLSHAPDSLREFQAATTPEAKARALTAGLGNLAMAGVAASHAYGEAYKALAKPKTPLEQVAPLTAEAVAKVPRADLATVEPAIEVKPPEILSPTPLTTEAVAKVVEKEPVLVTPAPTPAAAAGESGTPFVTAKVPWEITKDGFVEPKMAPLEDVESLRREFEAMLGTSAAKNQTPRFVLASRNYKSAVESNKAKQALNDENRNRFERMHRQAVAEALREGKPVPESVLADYPDLKPTPAATGATAQKMPWEMTRERYEQTGMSAPEGSPLFALKRAADEKVREAQKKLFEESGFWKKTRVPDLATRRTTIGALAEFSSHTVDTALRSSKVSKETRAAVKAAMAEAVDISRQIDKAADHRTYVEQALSEGKPVPESVLADYPDLKPTPAATGATAQTKSEGERSLTYREKADALALKLEGLKSGIGGGTTGQTNAFGILPDLWDRAVSVAQGILRAGGSAADAVEAFIKNVKDNFKDPFDEEGARQHLTGVLTTESPEPVTYGIAARVSEERARKGKIGVIEPGEGIAAKDSVEQGRALLAAGADPQMVLSEFERTKSVSSEGMAVARAHGETLAIAAENAADQFGIESPEYKAAAKADEDWLRKLKPMQTEWHKIGQAQQGETDINTGSFHGLRRAFFEATDKEFTPKQTVDAQGIAKGVGDAKGAADTAKAKLNDHFKTPLPKERMTDAEKRAIDAANKTVREAAARLAAAEAKRITTDKARQMAAEKLAKAAELSAQTAAERAVRNNAIRLAKADEKAAIKQADLAKKAADAARTAEEKAKSAVDKWHREAAVREAKAEQADLNDPSREVWRRAKEYLNKGEDRFDEIRTKIATDMGLPVEQVTRLLIKDQRAKYLADDLWRKQQKYRQLHEQAKRWLTNQETPFYQRALASIPRAMFGLKVGFHGTVALGTHAPTVAFQPRFWKAYVRDFGKMYKMVGSKAYYEQQVQDLMRRKNYITARRAGLVNDPFQYEDFNSPDTAKYFGNLTGMGNRGYSVLKILRQDMFDQHWDKLPRTAQIPEMAEAISDAINHATGVVKGSAPKGANVALFAPRLEASRVMWLAGDPLRAADTFLRWNKATPAEKYFAVNQVKEKAWVVGTYLSLLALNQGFLSATGSNQQVNMTDPFHSDWLKFKAAGMNMSYGNAMITMARLPVRLYKIRSSDGGKLKNLIYPDEDTYSVLGEYARSQASPFASLAATLWFRGDWQGRQLPNSNRPMPKRLKAQGITPYTWTEFWTEQILPIPAEEAARDVWRHGLGMSEDQIQHALKAMATIAVMSGTGARLVEDVPYKKK